MISYYTHLNTKNNFNKEILFSYFFDWLQTSKNKMVDLKYSNENSFEYKENRKCLKIEDFHEYHILGIQFITSDNYKKTQFIVEIIYDYVNQTIDLRFEKELNEDSKYISAISLPKIFTQLIQSPFIQNDCNLKIQEEPYFTNFNGYKELLKQEYQLPLIILNRNKKCCVNPLKLANKVLGMAHVVCVNTSKYSSDMRIYYPNQEFEYIHGKKESDFMMECYKRMLEYSIQENDQYASFDQFIQRRLHLEHQSYKELENYYVHEYESLKNEVKEYEQLLNEMQEQYQELLNKKEHFEQINQIDKEQILTMKEIDLDKQNILIALIHKTLRSLADTEVYRKRDILTSILKENEE